MPTVISGDGTITGLTTTGISSVQDLTNASVTPAKLSTGAPTWDTSGRQFSPNQVCFSAYATSSYTNTNWIGGSTYVNTGSAYSTSTGIFTAPVAGTYVFTFNGLANGGSGDVNMRVNGTQRTAARGNGTSVSCSLIYTLAANDTVNCYVSGAQMYSDSGGWSVFTGRLLG